MLQIPPTLKWWEEEPVPKQGYQEVKVIGDYFRVCHSETSKAEV
jgi:hypothetical protein